MEIRCAIDEDAEEISQLIRDVAYRFTLHPDGSGAEEFLKSIRADAIRKYIKSEEFHYFAKVVEGKIAGVVALRGARHVFHLFVAEVHQGKGYSRKLWEHAKRAIVAKPNTHRITVNSTVLAVPVYERFGFSRVGEKVETNGVAFVPMAIDLQSDM